MRWSRAPTSSWAMFWSRLTRAIRRVCSKALRFLRRSSQTQETSVEWNLTPEQRKHLRSLINSPGWKLLRERQKQIEEEAIESVLASSEPAEMLRRKGLVEGIRQVSSLAETLYSVADEGGEEQWMKNRLEAKLERTRKLMEL